MEIDICFFGSWFGFKFPEPCFPVVRITLPVMGVLISVSCLPYLHISCQGKKGPYLLIISDSILQKWGIITQSGEKFPKLRVKQSYLVGLGGLKMQVIFKSA